MQIRALRLRQSRTSRGGAARRVASATELQVAARSPKARGARAGQWRARQFSPPARRALGRVDGNHAVRNVPKVSKERVAALEQQRSAAVVEARRRSEGDGEAHAWQAVVDVCSQRAPRPVEQRDERVEPRRLEARVQGRIRAAQLMTSPLINSFNTSAIGDDDVTMIIRYSNPTKCSMETWSTARMMVMMMVLATTDKHTASATSFLIACSDVFAFGRVRGALDQLFVSSA